MDDDDKKNIKQRKIYFQLFYLPITTIANIATIPPSISIIYFKLRFSLC